MRSFNVERIFFLVVGKLILKGGIMKITTIIAFILVLVGSIVWLMVGLFNFNLVSFIFGAGASAVVSRIIYSLVGISSLWLIFAFAIYRPFKVID